MGTEIVYKNPKPKNLPYSRNRQNLTKRRLGHDDQSNDNTWQPHIQKTAKVWRNDASSTTTNDMMTRVTHRQSDVFSLIAMGWRNNVSNTPTNKMTTRVTRHLKHLFVIKTSISRATSTIIWKPPLHLSTPYYPHYMTIVRSRGHLITTRLNPNDEQLRMDDSIKEYSYVQPWSHESNMPALYPTGKVKEHNWRARIKDLNGYKLLPDGYKSGHKNH